VAAAGYDATSQTIRVQFHGGDTADYPGNPPEMYAALLVAPSKGRFIAALGAASPRVAPAPGPLETYEPDPCCGPRLDRALRKGIPGGEWECPKCETPWKRHQVGAVLHWRPVVWAARF